MFIVKYDASFNVVWSGQWNGFDAGMVDGLADGTVFYTDPTRVVRFAPAGTIDWSLELASGYGAITGMAARSDGSLVLTGPRTDGSAWLAELDASGAVNWTMRLGQPGDELVPADLMLASDGGVRIMGMAGSAPRRLFSLAANASGEAGDCSVVDVAPVFQATTLVLVGTPSHWVGSANADFLARMVSNASNTYGTAATACSGDGLLLQGTLFHDADMNGDYESGETCFPNLFIGMQPDAVYAGMNTDCGYDLFTAQPGTHVLTPVPLDPWWALSTDSSSYTVAYSSGGSTITGLDFGFIPGLDTTVLTGTFVTAPVVCNNFFGNPVQAWFHVLNSGTTRPDVVVAITLDSLLTLVSSEPPADSIVGQTVYWRLDDIAYYSIADIHMQLQSPGLLDVPDTLYSAGVLLDPGTLDTLDTFNWAGAVVCSFDPNDKQVTPLGSGTIGGIPPETHWLTYTVRFQNTGTFAATDVVIQDQLSPLLDPLTLQFLGASHALTVIDLSGAGLVAFRFDNIQLPDSGADEAGSHGHVSFRVRPRPGLHHLDNIVNDAAIFFDQNTPVITNTVRNTIINCAEAAWPAMVFDFGNGTLWANYDGIGDYTFTYQWLLNGNPIPGATGMDLQPTENGGYTVRMTDQYGCEKESEIVEVIWTDTPTSIGAAIRLFPNPMTDVARLVAPWPLASDARLELLDIQGRVIRAWNVGGESEVTIDRGDLECGVYLLRVFAEHTATMSARLIVR